MITASVSIYDNLAGLGSNESLVGSVPSLSLGTSSTPFSDDESGLPYQTDLSRPDSPTQHEERSITSFDSPIAPLVKASPGALGDSITFEEVEDGYEAECEDEDTVIKRRKPTGVRFRQRAALLHLLGKASTLQWAHVGLGLGLPIDTSPRITCSNMSCGFEDDSSSIHSPVTPSHLLMSSPMQRDQTEIFAAPGAPLLPSLSTPDAGRSAALVDASSLGPGMGLGLALLD